MGLDWHSVGRPLTEEERFVMIPIVREDFGGLDDLTDEEVLDEYVPHYELKCKTVGALKMRQRENFDEFVWKVLCYHKGRAAELRQKQKAGEEVNMHYVEYWEKMTFDEYKDKIADKYDCENCPLLRALNGADSTESFFLGVTVSSCDFRGKMIARLAGLPDELANESFREHDTGEMCDFANRLDAWLEKQRRAGRLAKEPYEKYCRSYDETASQWSNPELVEMFLGPRLSREEYEVLPHPTEQVIQLATHWLRTCADMGLRMITSY
mgnify:CR=1 FL=1|jgi:hypothetical protein